MSLITVIIPVEENQDISKSLYSLLNQNFHDYKAYVIHNRTLTNSVTNDKISYIKLDKKLKTPEILNICSKYVETEYVTFISPNDLLLFYGLKARIQEFLYNNDLKCVYGLGIDTDSTYTIKSNERLNLAKGESHFPENSINSVITGSIMPSISGLMLKSDLLKEFSFNNDFKYQYPWDFLIKIFKKYQTKTQLVSDLIYISKNEEEMVHKKKKSYFVSYVKETLEILDRFYEAPDTKDLKVCSQLDNYRNFYSKFYSSLIENYPHSIVLKLFLLESYLRNNHKFNSNLFEYCYLVSILNSIVSIKDMNTTHASDI